jgi:hypothetical protein
MYIQYIHAIFRSQWAASRARILLITATKRVMPGANANQGFFQDSIVQPPKIGSAIVAYYPLMFFL